MSSERTYPWDQPRGRAVDGALRRPAGVHHLREELGPAGERESLVLQLLLKPIEGNLQRLGAAGGHP